MSKRLVAIGSVLALAVAALLLSVVAAVATTAGTSPGEIVPEPAPLWTDPLAPPKPRVIIECVPAVCEVGSPVQFRFVSQTAPDAVVRYQWDFDGDDRFDVLLEKDRDWASVPGSQAHIFREPGTYRPQLKITMAAGTEFTESRVVEVLATNSPMPSRPVAALGSLIVTQRVLGHAANNSEVRIEMMLHEATRANLLVKNRQGEVVRELLNEWRSPGSSIHMWNGKDNGGQPARHGVYDVVLAVQEGFRTREIRAADTASFARYLPANTMVARGGDYKIQFEVPAERGPSRVLAVVGKRSTISSPSDTTEPVRLCTLLDFEPFPVGSHVVVWDGLAANRELPVLSVDEEFFVEIHAYTLAKNAVFVDAAPQLSKLAVSSNLTDPLSETIARGDHPCATVTYDLDRRADTRMSVVDLQANRTVRTVCLDNQPASEARTVEWDGRGEDGRFAAPGIYRLVLQALDSRGNTSLCSSAVLAVGPEPVLPPAPKPWAEDLKELRKEMLVKMRDRKNGVDKQFGALTDVVKDNQARDMELWLILEFLTSALSNDLAQHESILRALSEKDKDGVHVLRLGWAMQNSPEFADEFKATLIDSLQRDGKLVIVNKTNRVRTVLLNENEWVTLDPDEEWKRDVSRGTLTTRLRGQELVTWFVGPPDFCQGIQIIERKDFPPIPLFEPLGSLAP